MKKYLLPIAIMFGCLLALPVFTSCGDDEKDEPKIAEVTLTDSEVTYNLHLSKDYFSLWDVVVTYTDRDGQLKTVTVTQDWSYSFKYGVNDKVPAEFSFGVVGKPKATIPTLDPDKLYMLDKVYMMTLSANYSDGSNIFKGGPVSNELHALGSKLTDAVTKDRTIVTLYSYSF